MKRGMAVVFSLLLLLAMILPAAAQEQTIVEIAAGNPDFSTVVGAIESAGLAGTLAGPGPFTVFAPTNAAFEKLPAGTLESLDNTALTSILTYHALIGEVLAADVVALDGKSVTTVQGEDITIRVDGDNVFVNDAQVIMVDLKASNGVVHVIDTVLMPPSMMASMSGEEMMDDSMEEEAAPETMAETGAGPDATLPLAAAAAGLMLVAGGFVLRRRSF